MNPAAMLSTAGGLYLSTFFFIVILTLKGTRLGHKYLTCVYFSLIDLNPM
jgi:hypothetical protein